MRHQSSASLQAKRLVYRFTLLTAIAMVTCMPKIATAEPIEGFTEPYRVIHVASPESGLLAKMLVEEGDTVADNQALVELDTDLHRALLNIARTSMDARGRLDSASAELAMRKNRAEKLVILHARGHARQEEVDRAQADVAIAEGNVTAVREDQLAKRLEYERIQVQLNRRTIRAPLAGIVTTTFKEKGEFVAPNDPVILEIVQLNPLTATFMMARTESQKVTVGKSIPVNLVDGAGTTTGVVEFVSPTIDAESGLVRVKVRIDNENGTIQSGERCTIGE